MIELDLKQIRKRAMDEIEQNKKHPFHYEGDNFSDDVIDLLDRLEKAERKLEETTIELGKVCWESTAKINERDAQLEKSYVDRNALTRKQARIEELEAQLKIAVEALEFFSVKSERAKEALREIKALEKVEVVE